MKLTSDRPTAGSWKKCLESMLGWHNETSQQPDLITVYTLADYYTSKYPFAHVRRCLVRHSPLPLLLHLIPTHRRRSTHRRSCFSAVLHRRSDLLRLLSRLSCSLEPQPTSRKSRKPSRFLRNRNSHVGSQSCFHPLRIHL